MDKFKAGEVLYPGSFGLIDLILDKPLYHDGMGIIGIIVEGNKFENKLRIVGSFQQRI